MTGLERCLTNFTSLDRAIHRDLVPKTRSQETSQGGRGEAETGTQHVHRRNRHVDCCRCRCFVNYVGHYGKIYLLPPLIQLQDW